MAHPVRSLASTRYVYSFRCALYISFSPFSILHHTPPLSMRSKRSFTATGSQCKPTLRVGMPGVIATLFVAFLDQSSSQHLATWLSEQVQEALVDPCQALNCTSDHDHAGNTHIRCARPTIVYHQGIDIAHRLLYGGSFTRKGPSHRTYLLQIQ